MKIICKEVNPALTDELKAYLRHQTICLFALQNQSLDGLSPAATEAEKSEWTKIRDYVHAENEKARSTGDKVVWSMPIDGDLFENFVSKYISAS